MGLGWLGVGLSALTWLLFSLTTQALSAFFEHAPGVDLLYLPAGLRLILVLIFRGWASIGIALADPVAFYFEFGEIRHAQMVLHAMISGFVPLVALIITSKALAIDTNLNRLGPTALLVVALLASVLTPLSFSLVVYVFSPEHAETIAARFFAMVLGDFLGCLAFIIMIKGFIHIYLRR